jgi:hypothetical protein
VRKKRVHVQNGPHACEVDNMSFYVISKLFTKMFLIGRGDVTSLQIVYAKSLKISDTDLCMRAIQEPVFFCGSYRF